MESEWRWLPVTEEQRKTTLSGDVLTIVEEYVIWKNMGRLITGAASFPSRERVRVVSKPHNGKRNQKQAVRGVAKLFQHDMFIWKESGRK